MKKGRGQNAKSDCETFWKCNICKNQYFFLERKPDMHVCGEIKCKNCKNGLLILITTVICRESD
jgi:hypothetical protein